MESFFRKSQLDANHFWTAIWTVKVIWLSLPLLLNANHLLLNYLAIVADDYFWFSFDIKQLDANKHSRDANTHVRDFIFSEIIQRVVAYEDPPFRPDLTRVDVRPEFVDLIVDCWCDDPEERPHFFRIVERLKKISGRSVVLQVIVEVLDTTLPINRLRRRLGRCCVELHCGAVLAGRLILTQLHVHLHVYHFFFWRVGVGGGFRTLWCKL